MRAIKVSKVFTQSQWPEHPKQHGVYSSQEAVNWIRIAGWDHVAHGECDLLKCVMAKSYIDTGKIIKDPATGHVRRLSWGELMELAAKKIDQTPIAPAHAVVQAATSAITGYYTQYTGS